MENKIKKNEELYNKMRKELNDSLALQIEKIFKKYKKEADKMADIWESSANKAFNEFKANTGGSLPDAKPFYAFWRECPQQAAMDAEGAEFTKVMNEFRRIRKEREEFKKNKKLRMKKELNDLKQNHKCELKVLNKKIEEHKKGNTKKNKVTSKKFKKPVYKRPDADEVLGNIKTSSLKKRDPNNKMRNLKKLKLLPKNHRP